MALAPLPAGAQFLNVVESVFSGTARAILANSNYGSIERLERQSIAILGSETKRSRSHQSARAVPYGARNANHLGSQNTTAKIRSIAKSRTKI